ncbi:uncharacterized protein LOC129302693 [Prosopis cineraria]|uniref:uncharacterized protein LOC129302693 n=1 Tax=Prosopis cineraria TaxID=364024 RepID=UPI00240F07E9|nr:uncharacterized protein LOC129302693 [Prosopis cineraria]
MIPLSSPSTSSTSPHSFIFTRPAPILCNPLGFKRFRTSSGCPLPHQSVGYSSGLGFTGQVNSGLSNIYQQQQALPFLGYDNRGGLVLNQFANSSPVKLELPSNQFSHQVNVIQQERNNVNNMQMNNTSDPLFGADHQALTSGQTTLKKRSYCCSPDERNVLDGHRGFDDLPLNSSFWSSNNAELKPKDEAQHLISKSMNEDLSSMLSDWPTGNNDAEDFADEVGVSISQWNKPNRYDCFSNMHHIQRLADTDTMVEIYVLEAVL